MAASSNRHPLTGSERAPLLGAHSTGAVHPDERVEVTLRLRALAPVDLGAHAGLLPRRRRYLSREDFAARHGAAAKDIDLVKAFAAANGLAVVEAHAGRRSVVLSGSAAAMGAAFGVELEEFQHAGGSYRGHAGPVSLPANLAGVVEGVFGLDNRPQAQPHFQRQDAAKSKKTASSASFTPPQVAALYGWPAPASAAGQCIGLIELGGGFAPADIKAYFGGLGLAAPTVVAVSVDGGKNSPTNANSADGEVMLDIEVAASVAPGAKIAVYFAPNTDQGFIDAVTTAVHDTTNKPSVISISWGSAESTWAAQSMTQLDAAFQAAAALGVTVCVAAGDNGSGDGVGDGAPHVDFPASSPHALACGGTLIAVSGNAITSEVVWDEATNSATGGGVSTVFALPSYQSDAQVPPVAGSSQTGRGVPDVAGDADPASGYQVRVDGQSMVIGGTSAVAPLWAGLIALANQQIGQPVGWLNPLLYGALAGKGLFRDIVKGSNGAYSAGPGWDACSGWGSPHGALLIQALAA